MSLRTLIVDDDRSHAEVIEEVLGADGCETQVANSGEEALRFIKDGPEYSLILTDLVMRSVDGFKVLEAALQRNPATQVLILTGHGSREVAVQAMAEGALYYLEKPVDLDELRTKVAKARVAYERDREFQDMKRDLAKLHGIQGFVGRSVQINRLIDLIYQIAPTQASILITGESGTGKELVARAIHNLSLRKDKRFVAINCGGLAEGMIESELFGHVRGAFTGAVNDREGKFEYAAQGTLLLDEVAEMPPQTQVKLLRVLEDHEVIPVGSNEAISVDVRLITATHRDLQKRIADNQFRDDLYYRLKVVTIDIPPLRERIEDIPLLAEHFRVTFCKFHDKLIDGMDREVLLTFAQHNWPGNVRELRNVIESMVVRARGNILTTKDLPPELSPEPGPDQDSWSFLAGKNAAVVEENHLRVTLEMFNKNRQQAARAMGISERTLYRKIKEYSLDEPKK